MVFVALGLAGCSARNPFYAPTGSLDTSLPTDLTTDRRPPPEDASTEAGAHPIDVSGVRDASETVDVNVDFAVDQATPRPDAAPDVAVDGSPAPDTRDAPAPIDAAPIDAAPIDATPIAARVIGYWKFDEAVTSLVAVDSSRNGHDGVLENIAAATARVKGHSGNALQISMADGLDAGVRVPLTPLLKGLKSLTIAAWINRSAKNAAIASVFSRQLGNDDREIYNLATTPSTTLLWIGKSGSGTGILEANAGSLNDVWTHIATTYTASEVRLFVNGVQSAILAHDRTLADESNPLYIGTNKNVTQSNVFVGLLDEVVLFQVALSPTAITSLFQGTDPRDL